MLTWEMRHHCCCSAGISYFVGKFLLSYTAESFCTFIF